MHISSLPGDTGIGTMGAEARSFVDFLSGAHQTYWQILPLSQTSYGDSPYQSFSTFAGNPYFIDFDELKKEGLLENRDYKHVDWESDDEHVNYEALYHKRFAILRKAVRNFLERNDLNDYHKFLKENEWIDDYALFMTVKGLHDDAGILDWEKKYRIREKEAIDRVKKEHKDDIDFWKVVQYLFFRQWFALKEYANSKGIKIIGDCPIYVALDSSDVWCNPELFKVDSNLVPKRVAGVPPDGFTGDGQLWGNPLYNWPVHKKTGYKWWIDRVNHLCAIYDYVRIDHFRGLSKYYSVKNGEKTARNGYWSKGPGKSLVKAIRENTNNNIIVEDLGYADDEVRELLRYSAYPGMAVMEFAFGDRANITNENRPYNLKRNQVYYIGTHDNPTIMGWMKSLSKEELEFVKEYINYHEGDDFNWEMIRLLWSSVPDTVIIAAQDLLGLDDSARMNEPGILGGNWMWRARKGVFTKAIQKRLRDLSHLYGRA